MVQLEPLDLEGPLVRVEQLVVQVKQDKPVQLVTLEQLVQLVQLD